MKYKPQIGDRIEVFCRQPHKRHLGSPMTVFDVHFNGRQLHYVNAIDRFGNVCELFSRDFRLRLLKDNDSISKTDRDNKNHGTGSENI